MMVVELAKFSKNHSIVHLKWLNFINSSTSIMLEKEFLKYYINISNTKVYKHIIKQLVKQSMCKY